MKLPIFLVALSVATTTPLLAQQSLSQCNLDAPNGGERDIINGQQVVKGSGGIIVTCRGRDLRLTADSGRMIGDNLVELFGKVTYKEPSRIDVKADFLTYWMREERILLRGNVLAVLPSGSTLVGPEATYLRAVPRVRTIEELTAIRNPTVTIVAKGDSGKPVSVNAATIFMRGDSLIYASKSVVINRVDLVARADSAFLDGRTGSETIRLMFNPSVEGLQGRKFKLEGTIIDAYSKTRKLERVIARGKGHATSQDLDIVADTIDLRMSNDAMERAIAWSKTARAVAKSPSQTMSADSIDVDMPRQKVRVVRAISNALAEAAADTIRFRTDEKDWLRGDTITAWFDTTVSKDTSATPPIRRILATHKGDSARAYYHLVANDTAAREPAISYVLGREIRLDFDNRKVSLVTVKDSVAGLYLEPKRDTARVAPKKPPTVQGTAGGDRRPPANPPRRRLVIALVKWGR